MMHGYSYRLGISSPPPFNCDRACVCVFMRFSSYRYKTIIKCNIIGIITSDDKRIIVPTIVYYGKLYTYT